jgi:hypothetical protein
MITHFELGSLLWQERNWTRVASGAAKLGGGIISQLDDALS